MRASGDVNSSSTIRQNDVAGKARQRRQHRFLSRSSSSYPMSSSTAIKTLAAALLLLVAVRLLWERNATVHLIVPGRITSREENEYETTSSMTIDDVTIRSMSITYMKSYSNKWKDAMLRVDIAHRAGGTGDRNDDDSNDDAAAAVSLLGSGDFSGYHALQTSEYYTETLAINGHRPGRDLNVTFRMTSGGTFKVLAMTFCGI